MKHLTEYLLVRLVAGILRIVPYHAALCVGWCFAWCAFYIVRYRVREAKRRIREIYPERFTGEEIGQVAWKSWRNFVFTVVEMIRIPVSSPDWVRTIVDDNQTMQKLVECLKSGRGGIIATAHMGSWELAMLTCLAHDVRMFSIAAPQKNRLVDNFANRARAASGFEIVLRGASITKTIIRNIKEGKLLAILPDVRGKTEALQIKFLGKTANIAGGMGFIARHANVPLFPSINTRIGWGRHRTRVHDPIWPDLKAEKKADILRITQAFFDILTEAVNAEPEQWFWFNKRWIFDPLTKKKSTIDNQNCRVIPAQAGIQFEYSVDSRLNQE